MNKSTNEQTAQEAEGETQLQHPIESHRLYLSVCARLCSRTPQLLQIPETQKRDAG